MTRKSRGPARSFTQNVGGAIAASKLRLFGVVLIGVYVGTVPVVFDAGSDWPFVVPKAAASHGLAFALVGVICALYVRFGRVFMVWSWLHIPILGFLVINAVAAAFAADRTLALYGTHARMLGLGTIAAWSVLYFAVVLLIRTPSELRLVLLGLLSGSLLVLSYELVQLLGRDPFTWSTDTSVRPISTNGQPTTLAEYLTVVGLGTLAFAVFGRALHRWVRVTLFTYVTLLLAGAAATGTRSALVGVGVGAVVTVLLFWFRHPRKRERGLSFVGAVFAALLIAFLLPLSPMGARLSAGTGPVPAPGDEESVARSEPSSLEVRFALYRVAIQMVNERPILGYGPDNFAVGVPRYRPEDGPDEARLSFATSAHSWVAQVATGSGFLGLVLFLSIIVAAAVVTLRSGYSTYAFVGFVSLSAFLGTGLTTVSDIATDWLVWFAAAVIAGSSAIETNRLGGREGRPQTSHTANSPAPWRPYVGGAIFLILLGLSLTPFAAVDASRSAKLSQESRLAHRVQQAVDYGLRATRSDGGRPQYWQRLGLAYVAAGRWREAGAALDRAVGQAPWDVRLINDLAQVQLVLAQDGDAQARRRAVELADQAVVRDPNYPSAHFTRAVVMQNFGDLEQARRSIDRALELDPESNNEQLYLTATQVYLAVGAPSDAIRIARQRLRMIGGSRASVALSVELAKALAVVGQPREALRELDLALQIAPDDPAAQRLRMQIEAQLPE